MRRTTTSPSKLSDNVGNVSLLSNIAKGATAGVPPGRVATLEARNPDYTTLELWWQPPGDDDFTGTASSYEIRQSTSPLTEADFGDALPIRVDAPIPDPVAPGPDVWQQVTVTQLNAATTYYFGLRATDEKGNVSLVSNIAMGETLDNVAPNAVELGGSSGATVPSAIPVTAVSSSGDASSTYSKEMATDRVPPRVGRHPAGRNPKRRPSPWIRAQRDR